ncbi:uncharacterized protein LOC115777452 [Archocentrus centrarchus]|uniref:uncharacterized protein LOC115777452 n=1 Tax=Archocentrus centrarchus TaxID=63155 RepID=UPI0011E9D076|nr:uncharacterized protein LOC115777452 [Archocentrus centrarchus]
MKLLILSTLSVAVFAFLLESLDIKVKKGKDATLECHGRSDAAIILLKWKNPSVHSDYYVFYYSDEQVQEDKQDDLFKGRVQLRDPEMKDGDLSVILKKVSMNDTGTYECYAGYDKQKPQLMNSINLTVEEPGLGGQSGDGGNEDGGEKSGSVGLNVGLSVSVVLVVVVVFGFMFYRQREKQRLKIISILQVLQMPPATSVHSEN